MVLLFALAAGLLAGLAWAGWRRQPYLAPELQYLWLVFIAFLLQIFVTRLSGISTGLVAVCLLVSQILLFGFAWANRRISGVPVLICGVLLNLIVMTANGGFMPVSLSTASCLLPEQRLHDVQPGSRIGQKDILLRPQDTRFEWLADRYLTPARFPFHSAFSLGDVFIAIGTFWILAKPGSSIKLNE